MRKTKIICTIGPASEKEEVLRSMFKRGMNVARLNMSHGNHEGHLKIIELVKKIREQEKKSLGILTDLKGPEIRIKTFQNNSIVLKKSDRFVLTTREIKGTEKMVSVTFKDFPKHVAKGQKILLADGFIELKVKDKTNTDVECIVTQGGELSNNKSLNLPNVALNFEFLSETDKNDILFAIRQQVDFVAVSFVRNKNDIIQVRDFLHKNGGNQIQLIAKIENPEGVRNIDEIIDHSDGIMVARGDMGVEIDFKKVPQIQKMILRKAERKGKFSITATQMLESMIASSRPTRAEVSDINCAVFEGSSALMLSGETAVGENPTHCVKVMSDIVKECEKHFPYKKHFSEVREGLKTESESICCAAVSCAFDINPKSILVVTWSGKTAREISRFKPQTPIFACTPNERVFNQMSILFGTHPFKTIAETSTDNVLSAAKAAAVSSKIGKVGEKVIAVAGIPIGRVAQTNTLKIDTL